MRLDCELLALKNCIASSISNIPVKDSVTYLGIKINKNQNARCSLNFDPIIGKVQKKLYSWLQRDLSIRGRILLTKAEGISHLTYVALLMWINGLLNPLIICYISLYGEIGFIISGSQFWGTHMNMVVWFSWFFNPEWFFQNKLDKTIS